MAKHWSSESSKANAKASGKLAETEHCLWDVVGMNN